MTGLYVALTSLSAGWLSLAGLTKGINRIWKSQSRYGRPRSHIYPIADYLHCRRFEAMNQERLDVDEVLEDQRPSRLTGTIGRNRALSL